mgnify:FL=1
MELSRWLLHVVDGRGSGLGKSAMGILASSSNWICGWDSKALGHSKEDFTKLRQALRKNLGIVSEEELT